jgi:hypothetical protein
VGQLNTHSVQGSTDQNSLLYPSPLFSLSSIPLRVSRELLAPLPSPSAGLAGWSGDGGGHRAVVYNLGLLLLAVGLGVGVRAPSGALSELPGGLDLACASARLQAIVATVRR